MSKKKIVYFNFLNVCACLCVLGMHCNGQAHNFSDSPLWKQSMIIETVCYWAVPVFFMISGATLMNYRQRYSTKDFLKKRFTKTVIPFIVWTLGMLVYKMWNGSIVWQGKRNFIELFLNSRIENVYWFFIPLFVVYLCMPVLSKIAEDEKILKYMAITGIALCIVFPFICQVFKINFSSDFYFPITRGYIIYVLVGYLIHTNEINLPGRLIIYFFGLLGAAVRYFHTVFASIEQGSLQKLTWGYNALPCFCLAVAVFVFAKYFVERIISAESKVAHVLQWLSSATFGIYLMHIFVKSLMVSFFEIDTSLLWWRLLGPIILFFVCSVATKIIQKIPFLGKYIIPA